MTYQLHHGNCIDIMPLIERESVDAIVTDPPYGLGFMGKDWDHGVPGEHFWREAYRCVKPGAYLLAFGGTRTFHRLAVAIEDAGWEIRDCVMWIYGQGFPKSHDVSKAIDKEAGAEREVIGHKPKVGGGRATHNQHEGYQRPWMDEPGAKEKVWEVSAPASEAAAEWDGWGTALKPAWEPIIVARKPLAGTVAENVQQYGTGAMNIDACRIETTPDDMAASNASMSGKSAWRHAQQSGSATINVGDGEMLMNAKGRWPANLIHDGSAEVLAGFPMTTQASARPNSRGVVYGNDSQVYGKYAPRQHDSMHTDTGSAARFFYCAKASKQDRDEGCEGIQPQLLKGMNASPRENHGEVRDTNYYGNHHPTV